MEEEERRGKVGNRGR